VILVFGSSGQVASERRQLAPEATFLSRAEADLTRPEECRRAVAAHRPDAVINAAAYTAVDKAESEEKLATLINGEAPGAIAAGCRDLGIPMVHFSTDYVFDGAGDHPFAPGDPVAPLGAYGRSKLAGERAVRDSGASHAILRTSWVFSAHGSNFVKTMLRLSDTRSELGVVADQVGGPTPASALAEAGLAIAERLMRDPSLSGTYHLSGRPDVSWAGFAREIFDRAGRATAVRDIATADYPTPAQRTANSRLDCTTLARFGLDRPDWKRDLTRTLGELERT